MIHRILALAAVLLWVTACNLPAPGVLITPTSSAAASESTPQLTSTLVESAAPTVTETPVMLPTRTSEPVPIQSTPTKEAAAATLTATAEPSPTATQASSALPSALNTFHWFIAQPGTPAYLPNFVLPEAGCSFTGVAGQVFDETGEPVLNMLVEVKGTINGLDVSGLDLTGLSPAPGPGGYVIQFADLALESSGSVTVQLLDFEASPLSPPVVFDTYADCDRNLVLINFIDAPGPEFLPLIEQP